MTLEHGRNVICKLDTTLSPPSDYEKKNRHPNLSHLQTNIPFRPLTPHLVPTHLISQPLTVRQHLLPFALLLPPLLHEPHVHELPLAASWIGGLRFEAAASTLHDPDGRAQGGTLFRAALGLRELLLVAVDVVDDGDVFGAVEVDVADKVEFGRRQSEVRGS